MNRNLWIVLLVGLLVAGCCVLIAGLAALYLYLPQTSVFTTPLVTPSVSPELAMTTTPPNRRDGSLVTSTPRPTLARSTPTALPPSATPTALPPSATPTVSPPPKAATRALSPTPALPATPEPASTTTEERLQQTELPPRDVRLLAERLRKTGPIPSIVHDTPPVYQVGDEDTFWVGNVDTMEQFEITAVLRYVTPHLYMWVEEGLSYDEQDLARSAETFESQTYPTNRAFFGSEWSPGVDNDVRLHILHSTGDSMGGGVAGYYSSADEYSQLANPYSNQREMFYISLSGMDPGTDFYDGVLAHEFQHMIHWANDRNEETWVNEGCAELAAYLNGYDPGGFDWLFVIDPDVQLTTWPDGESAAAHYGASYLFMAYVLGQLGEEAVQRVVAHPANGAAGFDLALVAEGVTFEQLFADWLIANYLDNLSLPAYAEAERYSYPDLRVGPVALDATHDRYPVTDQGTVQQYGADYVELAGRGDLLISFAGDTEARLVPTGAHSGQYAWWSNRGDDSNTMLTRRFDLRGLDKATLRVWMWYDIEEDWDYAYVEVSTDGGQTWDVLAGPSSTTSNPNGNSFGPAYTDRSRGWIEEVFDLSPFAGQEVLVRFEYVTDDAVNRTGWLIDDLQIPELDYVEDFESGPGEWQTEGFVYSDNRVSQRYLVQLITIGTQVEVLSLPLDSLQRGEWVLEGLGDEIDSAVLVISALAPVTTETAEYEYTIQLQ